MNPILTKKDKQAMKKASTLDELSKKMSKEKLKKCKCGGKGIIKDHYYLNSYGLLYRIECEKCFHATNEYGTELEAIKAWNRRVK